MGVVQLLWAIPKTVLVNRAALVAENLGLRLQIVVLQRNARRPRLRSGDTSRPHGFSR